MFTYPMASVMLSTAFLSQGAEAGTSALGPYKVTAERECTFENARLPQGALPTVPHGGRWNNKNILQRGQGLTSSEDRSGKI